MSLNKDAITTPVVTYFEISNRYLPRFSIQVFSILGFLSTASNCWFFASEASPWAYISRCKDTNIP